VAEASSFLADSAFSCERIKDFLNLGGFESLTSENGASNHLLSDGAKQLNHVKSSMMLS